jgi:predicted membrane channel-forming protein YqfA (hemolysin III family)
VTRIWSLLSTLALLPATVLLLHRGRAFGWVYLAAFFVTLGYHASEETEFVRLDHALAYAVIASNTTMVLRTHSPAFALAGVGGVLLALLAYFDARRNPERYDRSHAAWHVLSGAAGWCFARGYS